MRAHGPQHELLKPFKCEPCHLSLHLLIAPSLYPALPARLPSQKGLLAKYGIELIGAKLPSIDRAEDRELFKQSMKRIGLKVPQSGQ